MKAILTFVFIISIGTTAMAQATKQLVKVETTTMKVELNIKVEKTAVQKNEVSQLYLFKNSRVKKALKFQTRKRTAKMA